MALTFRKDMFFTTLIIVTAIFVLGLYIGKQLDDFRIDDTTRIIVNSELDSESFLIERDFITSITGERCDVLRQRLFTLSENLGEIGRTLAKYDAKHIFDQDLYLLLRRRFFLQEIKSYTMRKEFNNACKNLQDDTILFFYDTINNDESIQQGYALDALVKHNKNLSIYSLDRTFKEPALESVKQYYNITRSPTVIINYKTKKEGFTGEGELNALTHNSYTLTK